MLKVETGTALNGRLKIVREAAAPCEPEKSFPVDVRGRRGKSSAKDVVPYGMYSKVMIACSRKRCRTSCNASEGFRAAQRSPAE